MSIEPPVQPALSDPSTETGGDAPKRPRFRRLKRFGIALGALAVTAVAANFIFPPDFGRAHQRSTVVLAADGTMLRGFLTPDDKWRLPVTLKDVDPRYVRLLLAYEDRRFQDHGGVDLAAMGRAGWQMISNMGVVSGASTLTMQVARLLEPIPHDLGGKLVQIVRAVQIETRLGKDEILDAYLTLAPMGGNIEGVRAASLAYLGKEPRHLTLAEAALLVAIPQSPERNRPDRSPERAKRARDKVLRILTEKGDIPLQDAEEAMGDPVPSERIAMPFMAPHLAQEARQERGEVGEIKTTIDARIQTAVEGLLTAQRGSLGDGGDIAVVVIENATSKVIAYAGSTDFWGETGQIDLARRMRSPGSALKPFIYGIAFDDLLLHPETLIDDKPVSFGSYAPRNFDRGFQGTVTVRDALHMSLNVPAVAVLDRIGPVRLAAVMTQGGARLSWSSKFAGPSLPMALGGVGITLEDLTMLYSGIANDGIVRPLRRYADQAPGEAHRLMGPVAAWYLFDVLKGSPLPSGWAMGRGIDRGREVAFKTGTSFGFRDAWTVGFSPRFTVGVWTGRADGSTRPGELGREAAAPIMMRVFELLPTERSLGKTAPRDALIVANTEQLPPSLQRFSPTRMVAGLARSVPPPVIAFPPDGATVELDDKDPALILRADGGAKPLRWVVDGKPLPDAGDYAQTEWQPHEEGFSRVTVIDAEGRSATSKIRLKRSM
ncbi:Biosynthetic peptidoglycan transglycosylase [Alphaproteobacteria bacterium SO-S41]|nr:Biosynthetic peptidoglycan transglycosylase [Alphaproteobacteria bacterium SO-S41]